MSGTVSTNPVSLRRGAALAATAAALFLAGCGKEQPSTATPGGAGAPAASGSEAAAPADADAGDDDEAAAADIKCFGINECSGQSACNVAGSHECGGQNSCKGKGWILASQSDCDARGGKVL